jgi:hypothetical protein
MMCLQKSKFEKLSCYLVGQYLFIKAVCLLQIQHNVYVSVSHLTWNFHYFLYTMMQVGVIVAQSLHMSLLHIVSAPACMSLCRMWGRKKKSELPLSLPQTPLKDLM